MAPLPEADLPPGVRRERRRGRRALRYTVIGTAGTTLVLEAAVVVTALLTSGVITAVWYVWALVSGLALGLGLSPLLAFAQDDGEETDLRRRDPGA